MINDLIEFVSAEKDLLFADDNKLFAKVANAMDCRRLQKKIDQVENWCKINQLHLNIKKSEVMTFTRQLSGGIKFPYSINSVKLERVTTKMDLGILFDPKMNFIRDNEKRIAKAYGMLGFVIRCSKEFMDPYITKSLYCCFVRPILEYASEVWNPYYRNHAIRIESIQKKFLLFALRSLGWKDRFNLPSYCDRLRLIRMNTLQHRSKVAAIMFIFKLKKGQIDAPHLLDQLRVNGNGGPGDGYFVIEKHRTKYGQFEPINYMCSAFNEFYDYIDLNLSSQRLCVLEMNGH